jgi:hypothetical protein
MIALAPWLLYASVEVMSRCVMRAPDLAGACWLAGWLGGVGLLGLLYPDGSAT